MKHALRLIGFLACCFAPILSANTGNEAASFSAWLEKVRPRMVAEGIRPAVVSQAFESITYNAKVIHHDRNQAEFTQTFGEYLSRRTKEKRVQQGRALGAEHAALLNEVAAEYGVPAEILLAIWSLETNFGTYQGSYDIIEAAATLAFDGRRGAFYEQQLTAALRILQEGHIERNALVGSWAGAMGQPQFIPTTFMTYAADGDGDGRKDIWGSVADVMHSAGNYLKRHQWQAGMAWGGEVQLPSVFDFTYTGVDVARTVAEWHNLGVRGADGSPLAHKDAPTKAVLIAPMGSTGPVYIAYDNFFAIMRWNRSVYYALTVGILADLIAGNTPNLDTKRWANGVVLSKFRIQSLQTALTQRGFALAVDGIWGPETKEAVAAFQQQTGLADDGIPTKQVFDALRIAYE